MKSREDIVVCKDKTLINKVVFVDGLPGCGKTLVSSIVSSLDRVELLSYAEEIEQYCQLSYLDKLSEEAATYLIKMQLDMRLYNTMMGRNVNFRPSDLSSVANNHNPARYFSRLFGAGDETIPGRIEEERPILNFAVHNMLAFSEPVWKSVGKSSVLVEVIRHPLYMIRQQVLNMQKLVSSPRWFTVQFRHGDEEVPYYVSGWEPEFLSCNATEKSIHFIHRMTTAANRARTALKEDFGARIITIPFESFVQEPGRWVQIVADALDTEATEATKRVMAEQNVPRDKVAEGIDIEIYRRCGWKPPVEGMDERDELNVRREDISRCADSESMAILDRLATDYENEHWAPAP